MRMGLLLVFVFSSAPGTFGQIQLPAQDSAPQKSEQKFQANPKDPAEGWVEVDEASRPKIASLVLEVCNLVLQKHIDPPTKQQLLLNTSKAIYALADQEYERRNLAIEASQLVEPSDCEEFLISVLAEVEHTVPDRLLEVILATVPGSGTIAKARGLKIEKQLAENRYVGVGIALTRTNGLPHIFRSIYGGPGYEVGVRKDDLILEIDGVPTNDKSLATIVEELRGERGTEVELLLHNQSDDPGKNRRIKVTREVTFIPTVQGDYEDEEGRWIYRLRADSTLAILKIDRFGPSTSHELKKLESQLVGIDEPVNGLILDLRRGGGALHDVVMVADQFLEKGLIGSTAFADREQTFEASKGSLYKNMPMVVLVSETSSASSVFLATALKDNGRAEIVGVPTSGLSYVRSQFPLSNGDLLTIPTGYIKRANGTLMKPTTSQMSRRDQHNAFVQPDHPILSKQAAKKIANSAQESQQNANIAFMETAIKVLKSKIEERKVAEKTSRDLKTDT